MGNIVPTAVCNVYERGSVYFPYEHTVELRRANGICERALVKLDAVKHGNYELLKTFLMNEFELGGNQARYQLQYTKETLLNPDAQLFKILPTNRIVDLVMSSRVCFVLTELN
jgi:hypothetical protein